MRKMLEIFQKLSPEKQNASKFLMLNVFVFQNSQMNKVFLSIFYLEKID